MKTDIMGIAFDNVTMPEAIDKAQAILQRDKTCYAVTPNAEIAYEALKDDGLRALLNEADLVLPDGAGVPAPSGSSVVSLAALAPVAVMAASSSAPTATSR